jgi:uncharacterized membrane protein
MNIADMPIIILVGALLAIIALFVIAAGFRLPKSYKEKETQRALMRKRYMELELSEKDADKEQKTGLKEPVAKA